MLPGIADRFRDAEESANAAVKARDTHLDGRQPRVRPPLSDRLSIKKQPHLIQIWIAVDVTFYP
jgi:hypothetical protein